MDLLCHCVSQDCTNCPVYKAWREGKDPQQIFNEDVKMSNNITSKETK